MLQKALLLMDVVILVLSINPTISDRRFNELLIQMDLPPERAQILMHFPPEKKWDTICDHNMVHAKVKHILRSDATLSVGYYVHPVVLCKSLNYFQTATVVLSDTIFFYQSLRSYHSGGISEI